MKVLIINGSPRIDGNTTTSINELIKVFDKNEIETETIQIGNQNIRGCIACNSCQKNHKCVFNDSVNEVAKKFENADGLIIASPVYFASANGTLISFLDRLFYSSHFDKTMKVGASIAIGRRGGLSATFDELNKYFTISNMPIVSSNYWNSLHGRGKKEVLEDEEGLQTLRVLAENMTFLLKSIKLGKEKFGLPEKESKIYTDFIK